MKDKKNKAEIETISMPRSMWDEVDRVAEESFGKNRSKAVRQFVLEGLVRHDEKEPPAMRP